MKWKSLLIGTGLGLVAGYALAHTLKSEHVTAEKALKAAKRIFANKGEVTGSWIHMVPEVMERFDLTYEVYRGGITINIGEEQERFEFLLDAKTGAILEVHPS
ncbi:PepSY domain-containing protein [Ectobacillus antri]|jgi:predicted small secreted protein|uniref:PepSY domain-containing protein n=1 Tax=Ectobacillus antri TaxID=2486280 RepID=UPI000F59FF35|nr:PepSY domain-containing protein [Ectobacillus antri]